MEYKVITARNAEELNAIVAKKIELGFIPVGSHTAVTTHKQNRFRGNQLVDTVYQVEYSQTMLKN